jgi:CRP-like cAMP-binding protein
MNKEDISTLKQSFLFDTLKENEIKDILNGIQYKVNEYTKGSPIITPENHEKGLCIVLSGKCEIIRHRLDGEKILLNEAIPSDVFGIISLFSDGEDFPTSIYAKTRARVLMIPEMIAEKLIESDPRISRNTIKFLIAKVEFLNEKIATFSSNNVVQKFARHLLSLYRQHGICEFEFNKKQSSLALNSGRASLYRAMDSLVSVGIIKYDSKKIYILDLPGLERITK